MSIAKISLERHMKAVESSVEVIAHVRRMAELDDLDMEEFDKALNDLCQQKHEKFSEMGEIGLALYGLKILLEAGKGKELVEAFMEGEE